MALEVLDTLSYNLGDYGGFILGERAEQSMALLVSYLESEIRRRHAVVTIWRVPEDSAMMGFLRKRINSSQRPVTLYERRVYGCPYFLSPQPSELKMPRIHGLPRRARKLNGKHRLDFVYHTKGNLREALDILVELHEKRWTSKDEAMRGMLSSTSGKAFTSDVVEALNTRGLVRLSILNADGRPISGVLGFEYNGRFYYLRPAFDPEYSMYAPGHIHIFHLMKEGITRGVREFDFLRGDEPYKRVWANSVRGVLSLSMAKPGLAGKADMMWLRFMRRLRKDTSGITQPKEARGSKAAVA